MFDKVNFTQKCQERWTGSLKYYLQTWLPVHSFSFCESDRSTDRVPTVIDTVDIRSLADTVSTEKTVTHANYQLTLTRTAYLQHLWYNSFANISTSSKHTVVPGEGGETSCIIKGLRKMSHSYSPPFNTQAVNCHASYSKSTLWRWSSHLHQCVKAEVLYLAADP